MAPSRQEFEGQVAALRQALDRMSRAVERVMERTAVIKAGLEEGIPLPLLVSSEEQPLAVEMLRDALGDLSEAVGRFQRAEARALYDEGMTMGQIADLFGITRPRVSKLLRETGVPPGGNRRRSGRGSGGAS